MSDQNLTIKIATKLENNGGLKKLTEEANEFANRTKAAFDKVASSDPFSRLTRGNEVTARLQKISKSMADIGSGAAMAKDQMRGFFAISSADRQMQRSLTLTRDRLNEIKVAASKMRLDADAGPILAKIRKIEMEAKKMKGFASGMATASLGNFSGAGGGAMDMVRGISMLSSGDSMEKLFVRMMQFDAAMSVLRGSKAIISGVVGGIVNLTNAFSAMGSAAKLAGELAIIQAPLVAGLQATAAAQTEVAATANAAAIAQGRLAVSGGAVIGSSASAAGATAAGAGASAAGGIGVATIATVAASVVAVVAGSAAALILASDGVTNWVARHLPFLQGHGVDIAASDAATARMLANHQQGQAYFAHYGLTSRDVANRDTDAVRFEAQSRIDDLSRDYNVHYASSVAGGLAMNAGMIGERRTGRQAAIFNEALAATARPDATRDTFARAQLESEKLHRLTMTSGPGMAAANAQVASAQAGHAVLRGEYDATVERAATLRSNLARSQALTAERSDIERSLYGERNPNLRAAIQQRLDRLNPQSNFDAHAMPPWGSTNSGDTLQTSRMRQTLLRQLRGEQNPLARAELQARLANVSGQQESLGTVNQTQVEQADKQREALSQRIMESEKAIAAAKQNQSQTSLQLLATDQKRFEENAKFYRDQSRGIRDQQRSTAGSFGLMDVQDQRRALDVAQQLARGDALSREDQEFARGMEPLQGMLSNLGRRQSSNNGFLSQIENLAGPGDLSRNETARQADVLAQRNEAMAVKIENQLQVQAHVNVESMARDLTRDLLPAIEEVQRSITNSLVNMLREIQRKLDEQAQQQQAAQNAGNAH